MTRIDNIAIVLEELEPAIAFFEELGMKLEGRMRAEGAFVDGCIGIDGAVSDIAMMRTPDGTCGIELTKFVNPPAVHNPQRSLPNAQGYNRVMFAVEDIEGTVARLRKHGAELVREIVNYENIYKLCYLRGPEGILVALAEKLQ
jgi:catechol 2,3-dioxygenase-like lactoylglutathione lyase family enzyme